MSTKAVLEFIDEMQLHFSPRRWDEEQEKSWVTSMVRELGSFGPDVLKRAAQEIIRTRKDTRVPVLAECLAACKQAQYWIDQERGKGRLPVDAPAGEQKWAVWSEERRRLADQLIMTPQGRRAAQEGWVLGLHDFIRNNGKAPTDYEERQLKRSSEEFLVEYRKCLDGGFPCSKPLAELGTKMLKRREDLAEMVIHGVVR